MSMSATSFINRFEQHFPLALAEEGDPVGLHIGTLNKTISKVMITLDVRPETVAEAIEKQVDLIVAKHPPIFRAIKRLDVNDPQTKMYRDLLAHDIAVYAAHTNMDIVEDGLNDWFCEELGIQQTEYLSLTHEIPYMQLVVRVPAEKSHSLIQLLAEVGATETFSQTASDTVQSFQFLESAKPVVMNVLFDFFENEEPEYHLTCLANQGKRFGLGRVGELTEAIPLSQFVQQVKKTFNLDGLRLIADFPEKLIKRVAICGGSGEKFYRDALRQGADVYLTGDVYYHTAHDMLAEGLSVIDPGHHIEVLCQPRIVELCEQWKKEYNWDVEIISSEVNTNPFSYY